MTRDPATPHPPLCVLLAFCSSIKLSDEPSRSLEAPCQCRPLRCLTFTGARVRGAGEMGRRPGPLPLRLGTYLHGPWGTVEGDPPTPRCAVHEAQRSTDRHPERVPGPRQPRGAAGAPTRCREAAAAPQLPAPGEQGRLPQRECVLSPRDDLGAINSGSRSQSSELAPRGSARTCQQARSPERTGSTGLLLQRRSFFLLSP